MQQTKYPDARLLVIDDDPVSSQLVGAVLQFVGYTNIQTLADSELWRATFDEFDPDLIILDMHMPAKSGLEVLTELRTSHPAGVGVPVLMLTADNLPATRKSALESGASDFLTKPPDFSEVSLRVGNFLDLRMMQRRLADHNALLEQMVEARTAELVHAQKEVALRLGYAADYKDDESGEHAEAVGVLAELIALEVGMPSADAELLCLAAPLHDIGKVGVSDALLLKAGPLTEEESKLVQMHVDVGGQILSRSKSRMLQMAEIIARNHHENWDGSGYPEGLAGDNIPLIARIVAVADVYDSLLRDRPYRRGVPPLQAFEEVMSGSGTRFDPRVVSGFREVWERHHHTQPESMAS